MWKNWEIRYHFVKVSATKRMLFCVSALKSFVSENDEKRLHLKNSQKSVSCHYLHSRKKIV